MAGFEVTTEGGSKEEVPVRRSLLLICILLSAINGSADQTDGVVVGVNTVEVARMNAQQQDAFVEQLRENGVKVVRLGKVTK